MAAVRKMQRVDEKDYQHLPNMGWKDRGTEGQKAVL